MFELIPSKYMQRLFKNSGFELSDFNKATIIWNYPGKTLKEKLTALEELAGETGDMLLKQQITERLDYEKAVMEAFIQKPNKEFIYVVEIEDNYSCGFFYSYDMAYEYGLRYVKDWEEEKFSIEKQHVVASEKDLVVIRRSGWNWNILPEEKGVKNEEKYEGQAVAQVYYRADGEINYCYSYELSDEWENRVDSYRRERFESQFFEIPFEGEKGTPVRDLTDGSYGVLMQDTAEWNRYMKDISDRNLVVDYYDIQVQVVYLTFQGLWSHEHVNPIYLEPETPKFDRNDKKEEAYADAMEAFIEYWAKKKEGVSDLDMYEKRVIDSAKSYRDICIELEAEKQLEKNSVVDRAEKVEDLII